MRGKTKVLIGIIILIIVVIAAGILTFTVTVANTEDGATYPYTTTYAVSFPDGEAVNIGTTRFVALSYQNEMVADIDGNREKLVIGDERQFAERRARITTLGFPIIDTNFRITLRYTGARDTRANFDLTVQTQKQVPEFIIKHLLPASIDARPK
jgi:hypothetical protein